jgi:hypothetical protein
MTNRLWSRAAGAAAVTLAFVAAQAAAVELANIDAAGAGTGSAPVLSIPAGQSTPDFFIENATGPGLYPIRIGTSRADDFAGGVLISSVREFGGRTDALGTEFYPVTGVTTNPASGSATPDGTLSIYVRNRVGASTNVLSNANVAGAYFPFSEGWTGGTIRNTNNAGVPNNTSVFNGVTLVDTILNFNVVESGVSRVVIPGLTDTRQQGLLFANHSKNEDNYASVAPSPTGDAYIVTLGNGGNAMTPESDPFAFVYIPHGTPGVTMASVHGSSGPNQVPTVLNKTGNFSIVREGVGTYRLSIPGQTPSSGVLMTNSGGQITDGATSVSDNVLTYQADGNDWIIQTREFGQSSGTAPNPTGPIPSTLETPLAERSQSFQFAFMPFTGRPTAPAASSPAPFNLKDKVFGFKLQETEVDASLQASPANYGTITDATPGFNVQHLRQDRGDNSVAVNGFFPARTDGIMFGVVSQGFRDNTTLPNNPSGQASYGMIAAGDSGGGWEFHTHTIDPGTAAGALQEFNVNFDGVFFGVDTGFQMAHQQAQPVPPVGELPAGLNVSLSGVNTLTDGILVAQAFGNVDHYAVATPAANGSNWNVKTFNNETTGTTQAVNWLYLPYTADNLVAGRVAADGSVLASTGVGGGSGQFTLSRESDGTYLLSVAGKTPADGTLLLTPEGTGSDDNSLVFEAVGNSFRITGVDYVTLDERGNQFITPSAQDTPFTFAFIDFDAPPTIGGPGAFLEADFNEDGAVNGADLTAWQNGFGSGTSKASGDADADGDVDGSDFLTWQQQLGTNPPANVAVGAIPEPASLAMAACGLFGLASLRARKS